MEEIRQWAFSICVALVVCGIAQLILPKNNLEKVFRLTVSVFFLCCILSPVVFQYPKLRIEVEEYTQEEIQRRADRLLEVTEAQAEQVAADTVREIVEDKLEEMGINYTGVTININTNGQEGGPAGDVELVLDRTYENRHDSIVTELEESLGFSFRIGYVEIDEDKKGDEE